MTSEQQFHLNWALRNVRNTTTIIERLFAENLSAELSPEDLDSDLSEAINKLNAAVEYLYEAKKTEAQ